MGVVRQAFLEMRIILDQGVSLVNAESVAGLLNADLILAGDVTDYEDYQGVWGKPKVSFSAQLIERESREVVWSSNSYNEGDEGVFFFDLGKVNGQCHGFRWPNGSGVILQDGKVQGPGISGEVK
jgi:hypothetical protein